MREFVLPFPPAGAPRTRPRTVLLACAALIGAWTVLAGCAAPVAPPPGTAAEAPAQDAPMPPWGAEHRRGLADHRFGAFLRGFRPWNHRA